MVPEGHQPPGNEGVEQLAAISQAPGRGRFITLEGGEGSGKSSLALKLQVDLSNRLKSSGHKCLLCCEPGGERSMASDPNAICSQLRSLLLFAKSSPLADKAELLLFLAAQFQNLFETIQPALERGDWVICDRFCDSTFAYQGYGRCLNSADHHLVRFLCQAVLNQQSPDLTLYLDLDPVIGLTRTRQIKPAADRIDKEALTFHQRVRRGYQDLLKGYPDRIAQIDAALNDELVYQKASELISERLLQL